MAYKKRSISKTLRIFKKNDFSFIYWINEFQILVENILFLKLSKQIKVKIIRKI